MKGPQTRTHPEAIAARPRSGLLLLTVFFTNLLSLACQVIWLRKLSYLFGSTAAVFSTVLSIFLLGLALGALAAGRVADRTAAPVAAARPAPDRDSGATACSRCRSSIWGAGSSSRLPGDLAPSPPPSPSSPSCRRDARADARHRRRLPARRAPLRTGPGAPRPRSVARSTVWTPSGAALGALLAGFLLVPRLGLAASTWLLGLAALGLGLVILAVKGERGGFARRRDRQARRQAETKPAAEAAPAAPQKGARWRRSSPPSSSPAARRCCWRPAGTASSRCSTAPTSIPPVRCSPASSPGSAPAAC